MVAQICQIAKSWLDCVYRCGTPQVTAQVNCIVCFLELLWQWFKIGVAWITLQNVFILWSVWRNTCCLIVAVGPFVMNTSKRALVFLAGWHMHNVHFSLQLTLVIFIHFPGTVSWFGLATIFLMNIFPSLLRSQFSLLFYASFHTPNYCWVRTEANMSIWKHSPQWNSIQFVQVKY